jgi:hypothetical protein
MSSKTVLFFLSDHGIRFGAVRQTSVGKLEERLPFMFLIFPDWFLKKYPNLIFPTNCLDMSITLSLVLDKTFCCEQVHQCGKMPASSQVLLEGLVQYDKHLLENWKNVYHSCF